MKTRLIILAALALSMCASQGAQLTINLGTAPSGAGGDNNRQAFTKVNTNFTELYTSVTDLETDLTLLQPLDTDLTAVAALTTATYGRSLLTLADASAGRTSLGLVIGTNVQAYDADLTTYAGITPSANVQTILGAANFAAIKTSLSLGNVEDTALSTWAGSANITTLGTIGSGIWQGTIIAPAFLGTGSSITTKYLRGDGTWQTIGQGTALTADPLSQFAQTTSLQLAGTLTDEEGSGVFVLKSVTDELDTRMDEVEVQVWDIVDPGADSLIYWNDTANEVQTTAMSAFATLTGTQTLTNKTLTSPAITGGSVSTATGGDNDTSPASTAFVQDTARGSRTGVHATPSTTNPLSPTWTSIMHTVWYGATGTINLPAASTYAGRSILIYNTGAFTITIDANGSEVLVRDGTVQTGGVSMTLSSGAGNYVAFICDGERWISLGYKGTLAVGS